jgi:periplasmic divalent cation tolerance protein
MADLLLVYVTTPGPDLARQIARRAVEEGLAACGNILPGMQSVYRWQGRVEAADETVLLMKTTAAAYPALESLVRKMHSYDVPCIVALPLSQADAAFGAWIKEQIKQ